jgi:hypothetical protein
LELVLSYLVDRDGPATGLEEGLRRLFLFIARDLHAGVDFGGTGGTGAAGLDAPIVIVDPANNENNVAARVTHSERDAFIDASKEALVTISVAQGLPFKGETISAWKDLFGDNFSID